MDERNLALTKAMNRKSPGLGKLHTNFFKYGDKYFKKKAIYTV
jgi:hypothetical protein